MMTVVTNPLPQTIIDDGRKLIGTINARTGEFTPVQPENAAVATFTIPVSVSPVASDLASNTAVPCAQSAAPAHVPTSPGRSYTKRIEIPRTHACEACNNQEHLRSLCKICAGQGILTTSVCVMVTLHDDRIELRAKYGRQRAEWPFEKLWDAAEGKLL